MEHFLYMEHFTSFPQIITTTAMSLASTSTPISYLFHPHIVETVLSYCDYTTLLRFRATCRFLKIRAHRALLDDRLTIDLEGTFAHQDHWEYESGTSQSPPPPDQTPTVVMRGGMGVLPFRTEADWTWACEHSCEVVIDGACLSAPFDLLPVASRSSFAHMPMVEDEYDPPATRSSDDATLHATLLRALSHVPRAATSTIMHLQRHGIPTYRPPTDEVVFRTDPLCDCHFDISPTSGGDGETPELYPRDSAKSITLRIPDAWNGQRYLSNCHLAYAIMRPSVEHLRLSANRTLSTFTTSDFDFVFWVLKDSPRPKEFKSVEIQLRPRIMQPRDEERVQQIKADCARICQVDVSKVHIVYSDTAGDPRPYTKPR